MKLKFKFPNMEKVYVLDFDWYKLSPFIEALEPDEGITIEIPLITSEEQISKFKLWLCIIENVFYLSKTLPFKKDQSFEFYYRCFVKDGWKEHENEIYDLIDYFDLKIVQDRLQKEYIDYVYKMIRDDKTWYSGKNF